MNENYPSAAEVVRNLADLRMQYEILEEHPPFRIVRLEPPYFEGSEYWVVNEKGFLWEPGNSVEEARRYLATEEAREYAAHSKGGG